MITVNAARKNKIELSDYDYKRDVKNRLLMSDLSTFDVEVLEEILHSSLSTTVTQLASDLEADVSDVIEVVDKLAPTGLCTRDGVKISVDKERRRYYEFQVLKFDDNFKPNLEFLQGLLQKVDIHVLPNWYAIPRSSTNIFESIVEKCLATPRIYNRYLLELDYGNPVITGIMNDVFDAPDFKVRSRDLRAKYNLSRDEFEEYMLHLEFNFICCLSYNQVDDQWKEVVTPFAEWRDFLRFRRDTLPIPIERVSDIQRNAFDFPYEFAQSIKDPSYASKLGDTYGEWINTKKGMLGIDHDDAGWTTMDQEELALSIYRHPDNQIISEKLAPLAHNDRSLNQVEKGLARISNLGWILFDDFLKGETRPVFGAPEVTLKKVGRRWSYVRPTYTLEQQTFIKAAIFERLFEAGFVETGTLGDQPAFCLTPFGRSMLSLP